MKRIKVGVIGVGSLGKHHARIYSGLSNVEFVGIYDTDFNRAKTIADKLKCPYYTDYNKLIQNIEAASIATPTKTHYEVARALLEKGINLLIEKPITNDINQAKELIKIADENKCILQVGHIERFNSAVQAIKRLNKKPIFIECHRLGPFSKRSTDIGVVLDLMIHDIDIVLDFVNSTVVSVDSIGMNVLTKHDDIANARITFANGTVCNLTASRITNKTTRKIRLFFENSYVSIDYAFQKAALYKKDGDKIIQKMMNIKKEEPLKKELEYFANCVINKQQPVISGKEAVQALEIAQNITNQIKEKINILRKSEKNTNKNILIVAGEPSGDLHGATLVKEIKNINPNIEFYGLGGRKMLEAGVNIYEDITDSAFIGGIDIIKHIKKLKNSFDMLVDEAKWCKFDAAILIDYPSFNMRLAEKLNKKNIPIIYYISPQVWAWGKKRIKKIKILVKKMLVLFKFEEELYKKNGIDAKCVGHPILEYTQSLKTKHEILQETGLSADKKIIALLPGSRKKEIKFILPILLETARIVNKAIPGIQFIIAKTSNLNEYDYNLIKKYGFLKIVSLTDRTYDVLKCADLAIVASGTATLETAIMDVPMAIVYKVDILTALLTKIIIRTKFIGMVNILAGKQVAPEFLQFNAKARNISNWILNMLNDPKKIEEIKKNLLRVKEVLGDRGASRCAAITVLENL